MFPQRLKFARKQKNLTQEELAKKIKTTKGTISNYENGYSAPSNEVLSALADVLETTTDYLLGRIDNPNINAKYGPNDIFYDPELGLWFKDIKEASSEKREELKRFWEFMMQNEKNRKNN
ncbi:TPA: helix-turn-helix transcriptional regulator [Bacillus cereus]|uniref:Helix-turn-helix transcriptional regulator n=1 Tax=Bacillus cereus TaxID=1396 RepID=A0AAW4QZ56_BACCE|nr:helix-turn-helix transcriptional regulator [Bacillus cereus]MBY0039438.1 helix-turn-helix transcriptional regulator [Bacillus cereus]PES69595.1 transcriptional regulator [Bacillus cereus]PFI76933.1 transcriptional regulator [Bacillus cereus]